MLVLYQLEPACVSTDAVLSLQEGVGQGGAQLAHNKHMLHCVRQERFTYTQVSVVWLCAKFPKGCAFSLGT